MSGARSSGKNPGGFVERTLGDLAGAFDHAGAADSIAARPGFLQRLDPRVKVCGILFLVCAAVASRNFSGILLVFALAVALAWSSRVPFSLLATRAWLAVLFFTGLIALPALFVTPGRPLWHAAWPAPTDNGAVTALRLVLRAETAATLVLLLVLCTPWAHVLKALRVFRAPVILVVILGMTHRYVFLLLRLSASMFEARRARMVGALGGADRRRLAAAGAGVLLGKSLQLGGDVFGAMQARGFDGEVRTLDDFRMRAGDWAALAGFILCAVLACWEGMR
jgi:cobalt ECF transporter T component CbiQ